VEGAGEKAKETSGKTGGAELSARNLIRATKEETRRDARRRRR